VGKTVALFPRSLSSTKANNMKTTSVLLALPLALALGAPVALAQATTTETKAPEAGANSFTEAQAKDHIEKAGFTQVSGLRKDDQGIWRATAKKGAAQVNVSLDFRGNVATQ
jgi:hypothetical protein